MRRIPTLSTAALVACCSSLAIDAIAKEPPAAVERLQPAPILLTVGSDGKATQLSCANTVVEAVCPVLTRAVAGWSFTPATQDGIPAAVPVVLTLDLVATPKAGGFALTAAGSRIDLRTLVVDGTPFESRTPPPKYPVDALRRGRGATVELELWADPGAKTWRVGKLWLDGKPSSGREPFSQAAATAARQWPVRPLPPQQRSYCTVIDFQPGTKPPPAKQPAFCRHSYQDGFVPPALLTDVTAVSF